MHQPYTAPEFELKAFNCPFCNAYAKQIWFVVAEEFYGSYAPLNDLKTSQCSHCDERAIWHKKLLIVPECSLGELPHMDMPEEIEKDMNEARSIMQKSPRGATALLRLCLQKLCQHLLGDESTDINKDIGLLVERGLNKRIQQAMDAVRITGNEAVHPGELDLKDNVEVASYLCQLLNQVCEELITRPKQLDSFYDSMPANKLAGVKTRDKAANNKKV